MQINQSEIKDLTAVITMTVEPADYQEAVQKELINIRKKANIPGVTRGAVAMKAARSITSGSRMAHSSA